MSASIDPSGRQDGAKAASVFGASGRLGREVVAELSTRGHAVVAFVHSNNPLEAGPGLRIVHGDVHDSRAARMTEVDRRSATAILAGQPTDPAAVLPCRAVARALVTEFFTPGWRHAAPFASPH